MIDQYQLMTFQTFALLCCFFLAFSQTSLPNITQRSFTTTCNFYGNNFVQWELLGSDFSITTSVCDQGWGGVSLHNGSIDNTYFKLIHWTENGERYTFRHLSHDKNKIENATDVTIPSVTDVESPVLIPLQFSFKDLTQVKEQLYITFVCSSITPKNFTFQTHDLYVQKYPISFNKNNSFSSCVINELGRISDITIESYFFELTILICILILLFYFRDGNPLKSRGLVPFLAILSQYAASVTSLDHHFLTLEWRSVYSCYFLAFVAYPPLTLTYFLMPFNFFRYVLIIYLNNRKESYSEKRTKFATNFIHFLNYLATPIFTFILVTILYIIYCLINFAILASSSFNCFRASRTIEILHFAFNTTCLLVLLIVSFFDFISYFINIFMTIKSSDNAFQHITKGVKSFIYFEDRYFFRIEQLIAYIVIFLYVISDGLYLSISNGVFTLVSTSGKTFSQILQERAQARNAILAGRSLTIYLLITHQVLFSLSITIFTWLSGFCRRKENDPNGLEKVFKNEGLKILFKNYAKQEWSLENYLVYVDIQNFHKLTGKRRKEEARRIFDTYFNGNSSPLEVNIDGETSRNIRNRISLVNQEHDIFSQVEGVVRMNLLDTYNRFIFTSEYLNYIKSQEFLEAELKMI